MQVFDCFSLPAEQMDQGSTRSAQDSDDFTDESASVGDVRWISAEEDVWKKRTIQYTSRGNALSQLSCLMKVSIFVSAELRQPEPVSAGSPGASAQLQTQAG